MSLDQNFAVNIGIATHYAGMQGLGRFRSDMSQFERNLSNIGSGTLGKKSILTDMDALKSSMATYAAQAESSLGRANRANEAHARSLLSLERAQRRYNQALAAIGKEYNPERAVNALANAETSLAKSRLSLANAQNSLARSTLSHERAQRQYNQALAAMEKGTNPERAAIALANAENSLARSTLSRANAENSLKSITLSNARAQREYNQALAAMQKGGDRSRETRALANAENSLASARHRNWATTQKLAVAQDEYAAATLAAAKAQRDLERASSWQARTFNTGTKIGIGIGGVALGAVGAGLYEAYHFQTQTMSAQAITNISNKERSYMQKTVMDLASKTGASFSDLFGAYVRAVNTRFHYGAAQHITEIAIKSALPTGASVEVTTNALVTTLRNFGISPSQAASVMDMLHVASARANIVPADFGSFVQNWGRVGLFAGNIDMGKIAQIPGFLSQALAVYSALTHTGIGTSLASTQTMNLIAHLEKPSANVEKILAHYYYTGTNPYMRALYSDFSYQGLKSRGLLGVISDLRKSGLNPQQILQLIPNLRAAGIQALVGGQYGSLTSNYEAILKAPSQHVTEKLYQKYLRTTKSEIQRLDQNVRVIAVAIGQGFLPSLNAMLEKVIPHLMGIAQFTMQHKGLTTGILTGGLALGGLSLALRGIAFFAGPIMEVGKALLWMSKATGLAKIAMAGLNLIMDANPVALLIVGLSALTVGLIYAYTHFKWFRDGVNTVFTWVKNNWPLILPIFLGPFGLVIDGIIHFGPRMMSALHNILTTVSNWLRTSWESVVNSGFLAPFKALMSWLFQLDQTILSPFRNILTTVSNWLGSTWHDTIYSHLIAPFEGFLKRLGSIGSAITDIINGWFGSSSNSGPQSGAGGSYGVGLGSTHLNPYQYSTPPVDTSQAPYSVARDFPQVAGYWPLIVQAARKYHINPYVLASLMATESGGNINALATWNKDEHAWDYGLYQYGPPEAAAVHGQYGPHVSAHDQIFTAAAYLALVGIDSWNGPVEANQVIARAHRWQNGPQANPNYDSGPPPNPGPAPTATGSSSHDGQPGWYFDGNTGKWVHVPRPTSNSRYVWDPTTHSWVLTATAAAIAALQGTDSNLSKTISAISWSWRGAKVSSLPETGNHGLNLQHWLHDRITLIRDQEQMKDNQARIAYLQGKISLQQEKQIILLDRIAANQQIQIAQYRATHHGQMGAANHPMSVRLDGSCTEEAKANTHRKSTQKNTEQTAKSAHDAVKELERMRRDMHDLKSIMGRIAHTLGKTTEPWHPTSHGLQAPLTNGH